MSADRRQPLPPGRRARQAAVTLLLLGAALAVVAFLDRRGEQDLRTLSALTRATASVVDIDSHRRGPDDVKVTFDVGGRTVEATIPADGSARLHTGSTVEVAYVPADPGRVRTVRNWSPMYQQWTV